MGKEVDGANSTKAFHGLIHEFAIWNRALTKEEIASAFSHPNNMVMGVGTANGSAGEFAGTEGTYDCNVDATGKVWRDIAGTLNSAHSELTLRFTPSANQQSLAHYLHVKSAAVGASTGEKARLVLRLNGKQIAPTAEVGSYEDLWCLLPIQKLQTGENVLKITYAGGTAASFALDSAEIVGSWQLGVIDGAGSEFAQDGQSSSVSDFTLGNHCLQHVPGGVSVDRKDNYLHFYVPAEIAEKHTYSFKVAVVNHSTYAMTDVPFSIFLNGEEKNVSMTGRINNSDMFTVKMEPGELKSGWNTINTQYKGTSGGVTFDYCQFAISDCHFGVTIFIR